MRDSIHDELQQIRSRGLYRATRLIQGRQTARVTLEGGEVLLLCSNNYLGLAEHPALAEASVRAIRSFGASGGASRLVSGTMELHEQLESTVAAFKGTESALVFNSGYAANTGIIPALVGRGDVIFSDRLNHASIVDGALLSGARLVRYPHNDVNALARLMTKHRGSGRCLIVTDGVFSMDGDLAPLSALAELKHRHDALLMIDDAHGCGVLGAGGRGSAELLGVMEETDIHVGTLGKAMGSFGAYAAVSSEMRELLINRARSFIFSTSLPPAVLAASVAALEIVASPEGTGLRKRLCDNAVLFRQLLAGHGFAVGDSSTQIIPIMCGDAQVTMRFSEELLHEGVFVQGIRPPTVPANSCRLRCTVMATHSREDLTWAAGRIAAAGRRLGVV
ncbi:8-amino-7-oxononanoate synthase [Geobacter sp. SVR]|uniref:8-amino-7-oxononanoate synthase n=1 Tax=Geobacter sp. SVR TaxID=2495594 RepID=UPI00143F04E7|nr:8-amino-7-oxononanoate synthase [Geobacter sp. SVR]BCS53776.1 8-amino-7-oxononanoate synthase [Geobacter sp. SVR]GCF85715.1 8-amino-7-oxononanoate synthase [Geobacter sp. SVR]